MYTQFWFEKVKGRSLAVIDRSISQLNPSGNDTLTAVALDPLYVCTSHAVL